MERNSRLRVSRCNSSNYFHPVDKFRIHENIETAAQYDSYGLTRNSWSHWPDRENRWQSNNNTTDETDGVNVTENVNVCHSTHLRSDVQDVDTGNEFSEEAI